MLLQNKTILSVFWELDDTNFGWLIGLKRDKLFEELFIQIFTVAASNVVPISSQQSDTND